MGAEARCTAHIGGRAAEGKALLETDSLIFRGGDLRLAIPFDSMTSIDTADGRLIVHFAEGQAAFDLGPQAEKWARKILNPPSLLDKLGVKPDMRVSVIGVDDKAFLASLRKRSAQITEDQPEADSDIIFFAAERREDLERLHSLRDCLKKNGAIWVVRPRGSKQISEADVMEQGKAAGLVDTKVAKFSNTHTAEKLVVPLARR